MLKDMPLQEERDVNQTARLRRFLQVSASYVITVPLLLLAYALGLIALTPALWTIAAAVAVILFQYALIRSGLNLRFRDPDLAWLQTALANTVVMYVVYSFDQGRALPLSLCLVVLMFGVLRFNTRELLMIALQILAGYALVINLLMVFKPETVNVFVEWFQWGGLALVLPWYAMVGGRVSALNEHLRRSREHERRSNDELRSALAAIRKMAMHDNLTGLFNRALFSETLQHALAKGGRHHRPIALFFMDLDRFKNINDSLGHQIGDRVLQETAKRITRCVRESDVVARLGGDEFVLLVEEFGEVSKVSDIAQKLLAAISQTIVIDGHELNLTVSIGICIYPTDAQDAKTLLSNADIAMYRAKAQGRNSFCFYSAELNSHTLEKLELEAGLRHGLERNEFRVHYQPKINIATGAMTGVEALIRWQHPARGLLMPDTFIQIAEETGLIQPIGLWTLREACTRAKAWEDSGLPRLPVAVNLSAGQFQQEQLVSQLAEILKSTGLAPNTLELEITESMVMQDPEQAVKLMESLREMGVRLTIDDFGTGYSSLGYLKRFPIDSLKVDRSFVRDLPHNADDIAITRAVIAMAHSLEVKVIAEGVENQEQLDLLRAEGCDEYQGYLCSRPLNEADLVSFIREGSVRVFSGKPVIGR